MRKKLKILSVFGTRPEAIKMAPLVKELEHSKIIEHRVCVTAQHRSMLDQVLNLFEIKPFYDLDVMRTGQSLTQLSSDILLGMSRILVDYNPDWVIVHGDTTTSMVTALAAYYKKTKVAHVEAGLRTHDTSSPWPEEGNRQITGRLASLHFAPTQACMKNLLNEGINQKSIHVTGNTVVDALLQTSRRLDNEPGLIRNITSKLPFLDTNKKVVLVTGHRRENFGKGFESICEAIKLIAKYTGAEVIYPVHLNPNVQQPVRRILGEVKNVHLIDPVEYLPFVYLMKISSIILTDSGGIQEEAPSLGVPVLVMRDVTERTEALEAATVRLVGTNTCKIFEETTKILNSDAQTRFPKVICNPYGDGTSSATIRKILENQAFDIE